MILSGELNWLLFYTFFVDARAVIFQEEIREKEPAHRKLMYLQSVKTTPCAVQLVKDETPAEKSPHSLGLNR